MKAVSLAVLGVLVLVVKDVTASCSSDWDCSLNGVCKDGMCACDPAWSGSDCGMLSFLPAKTCKTETGNAIPCGFRIPNVVTWGGSILRHNESMFTMTAAYMANHCSLGQWTTNSQVVVATSPTADGPFTMDSIAIKPWAHNPEQVMLADGTYVIYTLGRGWPMRGPVKNCNTSSGLEFDDVSVPVTTKADGVQTTEFTMHVSKSGPFGPWTAVNSTITNFPDDGSMNNWNPAPVVLANGSIRIQVHTNTAPWAGEVIAQADSYEGPYTVLTPDITNCTKCEEDPFMWKDKRGNWHTLYHRMFDPPGPSPIPSPGWAGGHSFSKDGFHWSPISRAYNTSVPLDNGDVYELKRRERPKLVFDSDGNPTHLSNGASTANDGTFTVIAPLRTSHA